MDKKDLMIISRLRTNARETLTNMSKGTKIPISTIYDRIKAGFDGVITKHTVLIDFAKIGYTTRANLMIKASKDCRRELTEYLVRNQNTNSVYKINNGFDILAELVFTHVKDLEDFIENLEDKFDITEKEVHYLVDDLKRETFLRDTMLMQ